MSDDPTPLPTPTPEEAAAERAARGEAAPEAPEPATAVPEAPPSEAATLEERVIEILKTIYDPEIPVNIYELGLIYEVDVDEELGKVHIRMTLTSPACPVAGTLPGEVEERAGTAEGAEDVFVELVWEPPWSQDLLSDAAKLQLGLT